MAGNKNAKVFPDPVADMPIISLPNKAMGQPWDWIGDGAVNPCFKTSFKTYSGIDASSKVKTGLGIPLPRTVMSTDSRHLFAELSSLLATAGCSI